MEEKLKKLYDCVLNEKELTTSILKKYGITGYYISKFINEGIIERVTLGKYKLVNKQNTVDKSVNLENKPISDSKTLEQNIPLEIGEILNILIIIVVS